MFGHSRASACVLSAEGERPRFQRVPSCVSSAEGERPRIPHGQHDQANDRWPSCPQRRWPVATVRCSALSLVFEPTLSQASNGQHNVDVFLCRTRAAKIFKGFLLRLGNGCVHDLVHCTIQCAAPRRKLGFVLSVQALAGLLWPTQC